MWLANKSLKIGLVFVFDWWMSRSAYSYPLVTADSFRCWKGSHDDLFHERWECSLLVTSQTNNTIRIHMQGPRHNPSFIVNRNEGWWPTMALQLKHLNSPTDLLSKSQFTVTCDTDLAVRNEILKQKNIPLNAKRTNIFCCLKVWHQIEWKASHLCESSFKHKVPDPPTGCADTIRHLVHLYRPSEFVRWQHGKASTIAKFDASKRWLSFARKDHAHSQDFAQSKRGSSMLALRSRFVSSCLQFSRNQSGPHAVLIFESSCTELVTRSSQALNSGNDRLRLCAPSAYKIIQSLLPRFWTSPARQTSLELQRNLSNHVRFIDHAVHFCSPFIRTLGPKRNDSKNISSCTFGFVLFSAFLVMFSCLPICLLFCFHCFPLLFGFCIFFFRLLVFLLFFPLCFVTLCFLFDLNVRVFFVCSTFVSLPPCCPCFRSFVMDAVNITLHPSLRWGHSTNAPPHKPPLMRSFQPFPQIWDVAPVPGWWAQQRSNIQPNRKNSLQHHEGTYPDGHKGHKCSFSVRLVQIQQCRVTTTLFCRYWLWQRPGIFCRQRAIGGKFDANNQQREYAPARSFCSPKSKKYAVSMNVHVWKIRENLLRSGVACKKLNASFWEDAWRSAIDQQNHGTGRDKDNVWPRTNMENKKSNKSPFQRNV